VLTELQKALAAQGRAALSGLGGVGETQTALEYTYRHLKEYDHAFWATAASREVLLSSYVTIAGMLKLSEGEIPEEVFSEGAPELGSVLSPVGSDAFALNSSISEVLKYSLLRRDSKARTLETHRLVQAVLKQAMDRDAQSLLAEYAVRAVSRAFPAAEFSTWAVCERLLPQAYACAELINQWGFGFSEAARLLNEAGLYLHECGRYGEAESLYQRSLVIREKTFGPEHPDVAWSLNNLAELYRSQGQYGKAELLYQRSLAIREKALGLDHPYVATNLNNLALLYEKRGEYMTAEPLYQRALTIYEKILGPEHPWVATSLGNLARLYYKQGHYKKAEPLYERSLAIREKSLRSEAPRHCHQPPRSGGALPKRRPIWQGRASLPTGAGDLGKGNRPSASPSSLEPRWLGAHLH
jgi:tetratricopeptide (TPR) repeat protein